MRHHTSNRRPTRHALPAQIAVVGALAATLTPSAASAAETETIDLRLHEVTVPTVSERAAARAAAQQSATVPVSVAPASGESFGSASAPKTYTVRSGDTISAIAARHSLRTADVLAWNGLTWRSVIYPGQVVKLTAKASSSGSSGTAAPAKTTKATTHKVVRGDTVYGIAKKYGSSVSAILKANGIGSSAIIFPGQSLTIPGATSSTPAPAPKPTPAPAPKPEAKPAPAASGATHKVVRGDTVYGIAKKYGSSISAILKANGIGSSAIIFPGQSLTIPGATSSTPAPKPAPKPTPTAPAPAPSSGSSHTVVRGDTVYDIAKKYGTTVSAILKKNGISGNAIIYPGQKLAIPGAASSAPAPAPAGSGTAPAPTQKSANLDAEQIENAQLIIEIGRDLGVSDRGIAIALATAMVESWIRNLDYGDRDSLGLFQQRPSSGWGTAEQIRDRERSILAFYGGATNPNKGKTRGLLDLSGWETMAFTQAAQRVQISAHPDRYGQWESAAYEWLELHG